MQKSGGRKREHYENNVQRKCVGFVAVALQTAGMCLSCDSIATLGDSE